MTTVTQWFYVEYDGNPKMVGDYEVSFEDEEPAADSSNCCQTRYWNGRYWQMTKTGPQSIMGLPPLARDRWRGLAERAK